MIPLSMDVAMPVWLSEMVTAWRGPFDTPEQRMHFVLALVRRNMDEGGGPFAAAIFEQGSHRLIAAGVNRVVAAHTSIAHAEVMALALAQQRLGSYDLGADATCQYELVSSCEPCAMCFGAVSWSGIRYLVCGASDTEARAIGFDEGPRHPQWVAELERRGIAVQLGVLRDEAATLLRRYADEGGVIYNGRQG